MASVASSSGCNNATCNNATCESGTACSCNVGDAVSCPLGLAKNATASARGVERKAAPPPRSRKPRTRNKTRRIVPDPASGGFNVLVHCVNQCGTCYSTPRRKDNKVEWTKTLRRLNAHESKRCHPGNITTTDMPPPLSRPPLRAAAGDGGSGPDFPGASRAKRARTMEVCFDASLRPLRSPPRSLSPASAASSADSSSSAAASSGAPAAAVAASSSGGESVGLVYIKVCHDGVTATITLKGPATVWFAVGFNATKIEDAPYTIVVDADGKVSERTLLSSANLWGNFCCSGTLLSRSATVMSESVEGEGSAAMRSVTLRRDVIGATPAHCDMPSTTDSFALIGMIAPRGSVSTFACDPNGEAGKDVAAVMQYAMPTLSWDRIAEGDFGTDDAIDGTGAGLNVRAGLPGPSSLSLHSPIEVEGGEEEAKE